MNNYNRDNRNACVRAVRASECQVTLASIRRAWDEARAKKVPSHNQMAFEAKAFDNQFDLRDAIEAGTWEPRPSHCFIAQNPKAREIHAPDFSDRVVHHWLVPQLERIFDRSFIHDSYANRKGKGTHQAVTRLQQFVRQVEFGQDGGWYLQLDIRNFFNSIHRPTLWRILKRRLVREGASQEIMRTTHALLRRPPLHAGVVHHSSSQEMARVPAHKRLEAAAPGCGLPIGNLSSQFFANVYMDVLDQFVKHELKAGRYLRYVDDFVLVHHDRHQLEAWLFRIRAFLREELRLELKDDIRLRRLDAGIDFLGYVIYPTHTLVRRRVVSHAREKLSAWVREHRDDTTPEQLSQVASVWASYRGHFKHAASYRLTQDFYRRFPWLRRIA